MVILTQYIFPFVCVIFNLFHLSYNFLRKPLYVYCQVYIYFDVVVNGVVRIISFPDFCFFQFWLCWVFVIACGLQSVQAQ